MFGLSHGQSLEFLPDDVMLPVQFFERLRRHVHEDDGCRKLIYAILDDSVLTYCYRHTTIDGTASLSKRERLFQEAKAWLFEECYAGPFSCAWICDHLGIEVTVLRKGLRAWDSTARVPLRILRRSPTGEHCGGIRPPYRRKKRHRCKKVAVELTSDGN